MRIPVASCIVLRASLLKPMNVQPDNLAVRPFGAFMSANPEMIHGTNSAMRIVEITPLLLFKPFTFRSPSLRRFGMILSSRCEGVIKDFSRNCEDHVLDLEVMIGVRYTGKKPISGVE